MLVNMKEMLKDAELHNYAIGSLNTPNLETLRAVIDAAEELGCPIIINHAQGHDSICDPEYGVVAMEDIAPLMKVFAEKGADLILLDIKMPEMNGIEALKEIRKKDTNIPIIMQSAYAFENDMEAARAAGSNGFITKPINIVELKKTISKFLPQIIW